MVKDIKVQFIDYYGCKPVTFKYDRILCVSVGKCPSIIASALRDHISKRMIDMSGKRKFVAFSDPYLMTAGNLDEVMDGIANAYKDKKDILVFALNPDVMARLRREQYNLKYKIAYYTFESETTDDGKFIKNTLVSAVKCKERELGEANKDDLDGLFEVFAKYSDKIFIMRDEQCVDDKKNRIRKGQW